MFDSLLDESRIVKRKVAAACAKGFAEGLAEARAETIEALKPLFLGIAQARFPALAWQVQQKLAMVSELERLHRLIVQIAVARDEAAVRDMLNM
jgi:hypothetical protein